MRSFALFVLLVGANISYISCSCESPDAQVTIRHALSLYAIEVADSGTKVQLAVANKTSNQKWRLVPSRRIGSFNIVNVAQNGTALDLGGRYSRNEKQFDAVLNVFNDGITQRWYIHADGSIVNAATANYFLQDKGVYRFFYDLVVAPSGDPDARKFFLDCE